jgi:hypothetical protein
MINPIKTLATLALLLVGLPALAQDAPKRFVQPEFAIGMWVPPQTSENLEQHYKDIAAANFNLVIDTAGMTAEQQLDLCKRSGLHAIVRGAGPVEKFADGPACWGYILADEPDAGALPGLAKLAEEVRTKHPGRFGYVNLFPNYVPLWALKTPTYDAHVAQFIDLVKPEVLSMDHYPAMRPDADSRNAYCDNLETMRTHALKANIPHWNYFYSMPFNDRLDPTEAQLRWQINTSLAYGSKGILYFCYWTPGKGAKGAGEFPKGGAIITAEGLKTRHYDEAKRINAELKALGPTLMQLTSTGVHRFSTDPASKPPATTASTTPHSPLRSLKRVGGDPYNEFIVGTFTHSDGRRAVLIVNHNYSFTAWPTIEFDADPKDVQEVSKSTGKPEPAIDDSPELKGFQLSFGPGDARLFLLPASK